MLMALTIVSVWPLLEPCRGSEDQTSISPLLPPLQAARASTATAASVPILRLSIHSPPGWPGRRSLTRDDRRSWHPAPSRSGRCEDTPSCPCLTRRRALPWSVDGGLGAVRDGGDADRSRAARR